MKFLITFSFVVLTILACQAQVKSGAYRAMLKTLLSHSVPEVTVENAKTAPKAVFLDAREPKEYAISHIDGSIPVGYDHFKMDALPALPKDTAIIVYCSVGYRSEKIAEKLIAAGYTNVSNLYGGIFEWVNEAQPIVDGKGETQRVHAYSKSWGVWLRRGKKVY